MPSLDVFSGNAFNTFQMTEAINKLPFQPGRLGSIGLFAEERVRTTSIGIEERHGELSLIPTAARNAPATAAVRPKRVMRQFAIPHIPLTDTIMADDVQNIRAFGSESTLQSVAGLVNERMMEMRQDMEVTFEHLRIGALKGIVLDADMTTVLYDWYSEFQLTQDVVAFDFAGSANPKVQALEVIRTMSDNLGGTPITQVRAICGQTFFDELVAHADVSEAFNRWNNGQFFREQQSTYVSLGGFAFADIIWEEYRGSMGGNPFVAPTEAYFYPTNVRNVFRQINAPANYVEAANTLGKTTYAKQERLKFDKGIEIEIQANPLFINKRPKAVIKGTNGA